MTYVRTLDVQTYSQHPIHGPDRIWAETNCYVDVVLELIHALGFEPIAALPFTLSISFEGDQWTFFKFPHYDLFQLYGIEIQELNPWLGLAQHIHNQIELGRPVLVELDSCYLPDTMGTTYGSEHVKSTVAVNMIDIDTKKMRYFHGQSYYELNGDDFDNVLQINGSCHERVLPPYIELVKQHKKPEDISKADLVNNSIAALKRQIDYLPKTNPFVDFSIQFHDQLPTLKEKGLANFHLYSFATLRQFGACYELSSTYLNWLSANSTLDLSSAANQFLEISQASKTIQFQLARAVARNKDIDSGIFDQLAEHWSLAIADIRAKVETL